MKKPLKKLTLKAAMIAMVFSLTCTTQADDPDKMPEGITILKKYADASGGADNYKKVKSIKMSGKVEVAAVGIKGTIEIIQAVPNMIATKAEMDQVGSQRQGSNGKIGWDVSTMMGPRLLEEKELTKLQEQANLERIYNPEKFYKEMKVVSIEEVEGKKCYKMKLTRENGDESTEFYSIEDGLQVSSVAKMESQMGEMEVQSFFSEYKEVGGIKMPHKIEAKFPNGMSQVVSFEKIEVNPKLDDETFAVPDEIKPLVEKAEEKKEDK